MLGTSWTAKHDDALKKMLRRESHTFRNGRRYAKDTALIARIKRARQYLAVRRWGRPNPNKG